MRYVLDSSALMALIEDEDGAGRIEEILDRFEVLLPWLVILEICYITRQEQGEAEADQRYALLRSLPAQILWDADEPTLRTAARLKATWRISLADAIVAAYAIQHGATLVHKDPELEALTGELPLEALPYK